MQSTAVLTGTQPTHTVRLHTLAYGLIVMMAFLLPLSTTFTSVCMYAILLIWGIDKHACTRWQFYFSYPLTLPIVCLVGLSLMGMFYVQTDWKTSLNAFNHILRLSFIPILAYYLHEQPSHSKKWVLYAFVAALIVTVICALLKVYGNVPIGQRSYYNDVFKNHIVVSYFMATGLLFLSVWLTEYKQLKTLLLILIALMVFHLFFLNTGRIGYIILYCYFTIYAWHQYKTKGAIATLLVLSAAMMFAYNYSDTFSHRINDFYNEFQNYFAGDTSTSIGKRLQFGLNSFTIVLDHPLLGVGTGGFKDTYSAYYATQVQEFTDNPHNQYLKTIVESGLVGLFALFWLFHRQWKITKQLRGSSLILAQALFATFFIGCLFNSWIKNYTECFFYILMTAYFIPHSCRLGINRLTVLLKEPPKFHQDG